MLTLLAALAFATGGLTLAVALLVRVLVRRLEAAHLAEREATDRLVMAWKDGAHIPPPPLPPPPPPEPLPSVLREELSQWESQEHKTELEAEMRMLLARGMSPAAILLHLDARHPG